MTGIVAGNMISQAITAAAVSDALEKMEHNLSSAFDSSSDSDSSSDTDTEDSQDHDAYPYEIVDNELFMTEMKALIDLGVNLIVKDIPSDYKTSAALNKKKVPKELTPKEVKREQRAIKTLLNKQ